MKSKKRIFIVGHHALLSSCELFSFDRMLQILRTSENYIIVNSSIEKKDFHKLGGIVKSGTYLTDTREAEITQSIVDYLTATQKTKATIALSNYGTPLPLLRMGKEIKLLCSQQGVRVRFIPSQGDIVSTASLLFNNFTRPDTFEFLLVPSSIPHGPWSLFLTEAFQDISWYTQVEHCLSLQDYRSGVLPLRLAQILLNIGCAGRNGPIFDPFCGSGVLLSVAALGGKNTLWGSDVSPAAIVTTQKHLQLLRTTFHLDFSDTLFTADASHPFAKKIGPISCIITEPYLGPQRYAISPEERKKLGELYVNSFRSFRSILPAGARVLFIFPVFRSENDFLAETQTILKLGFTPIDILKPLRPFFPREKALIYKREGQRVGRLITVWERAER